MNKTIRNILLLVVVGGLIGGVVAYKMWNKPHEMVEDVKGVPVTATQLCADFAKDEQAANKQYAGKALDVSGIVQEVKNNQDGAVVLTLQGSGDDASVQCTMRDKTAKAEVGKQITVKGFYSSNDMFGVLLTDCILQ